MLRNLKLMTALAGLLSGSAQAATTYSLTCDIGGITSSMSLAVTVYDSFGRTLEPGAFSGISALIPDGSHTLYSSGEIRNPVARYVFNGEGEYADVLDTLSGARFRVRFELGQGGLYVIPNPFEGGHGYQGSARYWCQHSP